MNNVSFGGIYLHRYPNRSTMRGAFACLDSMAGVLNRGSGIKYKAAPVPGPFSTDLLVCTGKDAAAFGKVIDKTYSCYENEKAALKPFIEKAKLFVHRYL